MTDPIADLLTRIRNASAVRKPEVVLPFSKVKLKIAEILSASGYIGLVEQIKDKPFDQIKLQLKYSDKKSVITKIYRVSKPGRRVYVTRENLPRVLNNLGVAIVSTSKGMMTNREARKEKLGGEVICEIY